MKKSIQNFLALIITISIFLLSACGTNSIPNEQSTPAELNIDASGMNAQICINHMDVTITDLDNNVELLELYRTSGTPIDLNIITVTGDTAGTYPYFSVQNDNVLTKVHVLNISKLEDHYSVVGDTDGQGENIEYDSYEDTPKACFIVGPDLDK